MDFFDLPPAEKMKTDAADVDGPGQLKNVQGGKKGKKSKEAPAKMMKEDGHNKNKGACRNNQWKNDTDGAKKLSQNQKDNEEQGVQNFHKQLEEEFGLRLKRPSFNDDEKFERLNLDQRLNFGSAIDAGV